MKKTEWLVKTNFGITFKWTREQIAEDYASTAIQWQHEEGDPKTREQLYSDIIEDEDWLNQWWSDYMADDILYAIEQAEVVHKDEDVYNDFVNSCIRVYGCSI